MIEFTKEQLAAVVHDRATVIHDGGSFSLNVQDLAAFTLAQMERVEDLERTLSTAIKNHLCEVDKRKQAETISAGNLARAEKAEAELSDLEALHELMSKAWRRADQRWLAQDPEHRSMKRPDLTDQFIWMMEQIDKVEAERDRLRAELREAEKRMKAWGCPDFDFICLNCGRETPCITEADLRPGDPGVPCTFDLTYPQMIERLRHYEDRQRKAEAERDEANAERDDAVARWARRAREAEATVKDYLTVQAERDRLRAQLDSILANSQSLESGKLADAHAEIARLREELREAEEAIRSIVKLVLRVKTGEPREAIWSLLKSFKSVASNTPAVHRARERAK